MRHHGNIAHELAAINPAEAERVLGLMLPPGGNNIDQKASYIVRVCYRMARTDIKRAKKLADSINDKAVRAYAYGSMAAGIADEDRPTALGLYRNGFDLLHESTSQDVPQRYQYFPGSVAAVLLPIGEDIGVGEEYLWEALSFVTPAISKPSGNSQVDPIAALAGMSAEYNPKVAKQLSRLAIQHAQHGIFTCLQHLFGNRRSGAGRRRSFLDERLGAQLSIRSRETANCKSDNSSPNAAAPTHSLWNRDLADRCRGYRQLIQRLLHDRKLCFGPALMGSLGGSLWLWESDCPRTVSRKS